MADRAMLKIAIFPQELHDGVLRFTKDEIERIEKSGARLEDGQYYAYTFHTASVLYKYVNDHYLLDLWAQAVSRQIIDAYETWDIDQDGIIKLLKCRQQLTEKEIIKIGKNQRLIG